MRLRCPRRLPAALALLAALTCADRGRAQAATPDSAEPPALVDAAGEPVTTAERWRAHRRPELLELFRQHVYGRVPKAAREAELRVEQIEHGPALDGAAVRRQWRLHYGARGQEHDGRAAGAIDVLAFVPAAARDGARVPVFLALNFQGNHTVHADPAFRLPAGWVRNDERRGLTDHRARDADRGIASSRWPIERIVAAGFGIVTAYYGDIDPDVDDGFANGVHGAFGHADTDDAWGSIAAWAWGLSRVLDTFADVPGIDARRVALLGHSRLGKTALWAGANDERFAIVISNDSGCGGAALSRRRVGETVAAINERFPHWFCRGFRRYSDREAELPVDQHLLLALVAPRPIYVASAVEDRWADPEGEFLAQVGAAPVYRLLGRAPFAGTGLPAVDEPIRGVQAYHIRSGRHDVTDYDWQQYLRFAGEHFGR